MGLRLVTEPISYPVTLEEAKAHLRVVDNDNDLTINLYIAAATATAEAFLGRALIDQTWDYFIDAFPVGDIQIPKPPLIEIVEVVYTDQDAVEQTWAFDQYSIDTNGPDEFGWLIPAFNASYPSTLDAANVVRIRFRAGYLNLNSPTEQKVPFDIKAAILLMIGSFFEHREDIVVGSIVNKLPIGSEALLRRHRVLLGMA